MVVVVRVQDGGSGVRRPDFYSLRAMSWMERGHQARIQLDHQRKALASRNRRQG